uniref:Transient receptor potential cation channel, subfamily V, member 1 n=1 Tax=Astyanax mexicanus TaxID=7994 RepID=A0A8B9H5A4_ASTMX
YIDLSGMGVLLNDEKNKRGIKEDPSQREKERFDIKRLFDAVASGDVSKLEGLKEYLSKTNKKLTDTEFDLVLYSCLLCIINCVYNASEAVLVLCYTPGLKYHVSGAKCTYSYCSFSTGELPLSLAACTNQKEIVDLLMDNPVSKADVREKDSQGNTVLHALVAVADNSPENTDFVICMYDYILTKDAHMNPKRQKLEDIQNNQGLTTIKLAAKTGKIGLFEHILHREFQQEECRHLSRKFTEWAYGPIYSSLYDLASVDTYEKNSVLEIVVYGTEIPNRLEMLQVEPLNKLLEDKWNRFAHRIFLFNFICYLIYLFIFTAICSHHREGQVSSGHIHATTTTPNQPPPTKWWPEFGSGLGRAWMCWMILDMILSDMLRFLFVYIVFLVGFSAGGRSLFTDPDTSEGCTKPTYKNISFTTLELFKFTIGMGDLEFTDQYQYQHVFYILLIAYIILTYILLLNMLIALMSKRVEKMSKESTSIWRLQRAITTLDLERTLCWCLKTKLRSGVERDLGKRETDVRQCLR